MEIKIPETGAFRISASAGSGKTHNLTRLFIMRMLKARDAYKSMLAITFTNKAANELRARIISRLRELADPVKEIGETGFFGFQDRESLSTRASEVLSAVLHDNDNLRVTTIDSFFQTIFSNLAIESGLPPGLRTELDINLVKKEILEEGLRRKDPEAIRILVENLSVQLEESGKDWRTVSYLKKQVLDTVFEDKVVSAFLSPESEQGLDDERLSEATKVLSEYVASLEKEVRESAIELVKKLGEFGIDETTYESSIDGNFYGEISKVWRAAKSRFIPDPSVKQTEKGKFTYLPKSRPFSTQEFEALEPFIRRYGESRSANIIANHRLAVYLVKHISSTRLLVFFRRILQEQNQKNNRFLLSEVKYLLQNILHEDEVPFLFEKIGSRLHTLLIDEFQDTDRVQWKVLLPLARVVVENGGLFSVVGDVKQSIYGWRGADSSLFKEGFSDDLSPFPVLDDSLKTNYRSQYNIVRFNNWLFSELASSYANNLEECGNVRDASTWDATINSNYEDVGQFVKPAFLEEKAGFVEVRVRPRKQAAGEENEEEEISQAGFFDWLPSEIMRLQDGGFKASDIAILVRTNKDAKEAIRVLDNARKHGNSAYDFSFTTAASGKAGQQPLFIFLVLAMRKAYGIKPSRFELVQMESLADQLGLASRFCSGSESWRDEWLNRKSNSSEPDAMFLEQVQYFGIQELADHQMLLVQFQELVFRYIREESFQYPDFFIWWQEKASEQDISLGTDQEGIKIMTIHRSKGLDFGVVILPIFSTGSGESKALHDAGFWAAGAETPWNIHPLLKGKGAKYLLKSDLGMEYQEDVFRRAVEALNTFYVACTRPRHGLIIDINLEGNFEKQGSSFYRLPYQTGKLLLGQFGKTNFPFDENESKLEEGLDGLMLRFKVGEIVAMPDKKDEKDLILPSEKSRFASFPARLSARKSETTVLGQRVGVLVHKILEKIILANEWPEKLQLEFRTGAWLDSELNSAAEELESLFQNAEMKFWFSGDWNQFPEQELMSPEGKILRIDRILEKDGQFILLDFKTGEESESHWLQIREYLNMFKMASGMDASAWIVYSRKAKAYILT